ncbi:hypothetical protein [Halomicrobium urmianum]|uniref:hypothetical protein n=1 Tax=Halomicrobium urmianum TaxID=1586233 RepID=UPI001CD974CD|nr:hypothetical protein [Halomicrobium urmianum]
MNANQYDWNVQVHLGGVTFEGPGMETRAEAEAIKGIVEESSEVDEVEVFRQ